MTPLERAIDRVGNIASFASKIGVATSTPSMWKKRESLVPPEHCAAVESATGVPRWELRPNDWYRIWPEIVGTAGAPEPPQREAA